MEGKPEWWSSEGGFFGQKYIEGDNSLEGFIRDKKETLTERTKREVEGVIRLTKISKDDKILDIPCGYGRHSIELSKRGFSVIGMDINDEHLAQAKKEAGKQKIAFLKRDMRNIGKDNHSQFDLVINMFYSFGFFQEEEENIHTMKELYRALKKGGKLLLHTDVSPEMIQRGKYRLKEKRTLNDNKKLLIEEEYNSETKRIEGSWTIISDNKREKLHPYSVRIYTQQEFETLAREAGFNQIKFYGSFKGDKFTPDSPELIMLAEKN